MTGRPDTRTALVFRLPQSGPCDIGVGRDDGRRVTPT